MENKLKIIKASEIEPKEIAWLWHPYIPYGKITLVQGDPGDGKSSFMLALAALLTTGAPLPFREEERSPVNVIYQTTEDDADDTVVPRFIKAGGDRERLLFISEKEKALTFSDGRIADAIRKVGAKLLVLDPLSSYIGGDVSINLANDVRTQFNPLIQSAKETGCAIVIVGHMNKLMGTKAIYRSTGSIDVVGAARSALLIARTDRDRPNERIMAVQKSNLAPTGKAILFSVSETGIEWLEETERTADEILGNVSVSSGGRPDTAVSRAKEIICEMLSEGAKPQREVMARITAEGIGRRTGDSAKAQLGVKSFREGDVWHWRL